LVRTGRNPAATISPTCAAVRILRGHPNQGNGGREGIESQFAFANGGFQLLLAQDLEFEIAMTRAYHRWLADYCSAYPERLKGFAVLPMREYRSDACGGDSEVAREPWAVGSTCPGTSRIAARSSGLIRLAGLPKNRFAPRASTVAPRSALRAGTFDMNNNLFLQHSPPTIRMHARAPRR